MKAEVVLSPAELSRYEVQGKTAVVIDVLRFTTVVLTALEAGMSAFYPVGTVEEALERKRNEPSLFLQGERDFRDIPGFDFGNSPLCHVGKRYSGERMVCTTTNGTNALLAVSGAEEVVLACIRSARAVAQYLIEQSRVKEQNGQITDLLIVPAGLHGRFSLEDTWCAGQLLSHLPLTERGDGAITAQAIFEGMPLTELRDGEDARILKKMGAEADLDFCLAPDTSDGFVVWDAETGWGRLLA